MTRLDERIRVGLDRLAEPADPAGVDETVLRRIGRAEAMRRVRVVTLAVIVVAFSTAGFLGLVRVFGGRESGQPASDLPTVGRITFVVSTFRRSSISSIEPDGSDRVELLKTEDIGTDLEWSADGRRLLYGTGPLFILDLDTGQRTRLSVNGSGASWSPDGSRVVFAGRRGGSAAIVVMNADGSGRIELTEASSLGWTDWSPDGSRILFVGPGPVGADEGWDIYVMNADGSGVTNLTNSETVDLDPSWSPDGSTILFRSRPHLQGYPVGGAPDELYLMAPDGSEVRRLTTDDAVDQSPVWSPDGEWIAFTSEGPDEVSAIYVMRADGSDRALVAQVTASGLAWQPLPGERAPVSPTTSVPPAGADTDAAGSWVLTSGTLRGKPIPIVPGHRITLTIEGESAGGRAPCNSYGQTITIEGESLTLGEGSSTAIGCRADVMASEDAYLTALRGSDTIVRDEETLVISGPGSSLRFERLAPIPEAALLDTVWVLDQLIDGETATTAHGEPATLELRSNGSFTGSTGCRQLTGTFVITGDEILATKMSADGRCPVDLADQDAHVVGVLGDGFTVAIQGDRLTVMAKGNLGLSFRSP